MRIDGYYNREPIGLSDNPMKLQHEKTRNSSLMERKSFMPFVI